VVTPRIDGREASRRVREYFWDLHGDFALAGFRIELVEYRPDERTWYVKCRITVSGVPWVYEVLLTDDGDIQKVVRIDEPPESRWGFPPPPSPSA
jgi:hypothetical protein